MPKARSPLNISMRRQTSPEHNREWRPYFAHVGESVGDGDVGEGMLLIGGGYCKEVVKLISLEARKLRPSILVEGEIEL
jgi:hypothetical protein